ncbi:methyltransferase domain-containing protein [Effusibacillus consociatus]|uniref:Methyltransferase domain-containing protein n=1 Tax=Effusibacillus consociatus TaxID=1117041 RepID=A0ABV9PV35_9BACL
MHEYHISRHDNQLSLSLPDQSVDTLFSHFLLHRKSRHDVPEILKEYNRVLKPGGRLIIQVPNLEWIAKRYMEGKIKFSDLDLLVYGNQVDETDFIETGFDVSRLTNLLDMAGFENTQVNKLDELNMEIQSTKCMKVENL